ncbi:hypothetical protein HDU97_000505 [Phlyctochytrium planicorne]|nr:hypothetical protein HDU97_000505 [Phlyctochytrium planicorne]
MEFPMALRSPSASDESDFNIMFFPPEDKEFIHFARFVKNPAVLETTTTKTRSKADGSETLPDKDDLSPASNAVSVTRSVCQLYSVPLSEIKISGTAGIPPSQAYSMKSISAGFHTAYKLDGRIHLLSVSRHSMPNPEIAFVRYRVDGEFVKYYADVIEVGPNGSYKPEEAAIGSGTVSDAGNNLDCEGKLAGGRIVVLDWIRDIEDALDCKCFLSKQENISSCSTPDGPMSKYRQYEMPGNMWIHRFSYGYSGGLLYSRQLDSAAFRIVGRDHRLLDSDPEMPLQLKSENTVAGPKYPKWLQGTSIALMDIYAEEGNFAVLDIRYKSLDDDSFHFFAHIFHLKAGENEWSMMKRCVDRLLIVLQERASLKAEADEEPPHVDEFHFITNPAIATSSSRKSLAFVYRSAIHTLDFDPRRISADNPSGYVRSLKRIVGLTPTQLRVRGATMDANGESVTFVTDGDSVISMRRSRAVTHEPKVEPFGMAPEVANFFDNQMNVEPDTAALVPLYRQWYIWTLWNAEVAGLPEELRTARVVSLAIAPKLVDGQNQSVFNGSVGEFESGSIVHD